MPEPRKIGRLGCNRSQAYLDHGFDEREKNAAIATKLAMHAVFLKLSSTLSWRGMECMRVYQLPVPTSQWGRPSHRSWSLSRLYVFFQHVREGEDAAVPSLSLLVSLPVPLQAVIWMGSGCSLRHVTFPGSHPRPCRHVDIFEQREACAGGRAQLELTPVSE